MYKILITTLLLIGSINTQAQSIFDLFKSSSTTTQTTVETTPITTKAIKGTWSYTKLAVGIAEGSSLSAFAGGITSQVESSLNSIASSNGVSADMFSVTISNKSMTFLFDDGTKIECDYTLNEDAGSISVDVGTLKDIEIGTITTSQITLTDETLTVLIEAKKLIEIADKVESITENTQYQMVRGIVTSFDGILLGCSLTKM